MKTHRTWIAAALAAVTATSLALAACGEPEVVQAVPRRHEVSADDLEPGAGVDFCGEFPIPEAEPYQPGPETGLVVGEDEHVIGEPGVPVTIILYTDLATEWTPGVVAAVEGVVEDRPELARVVFRHAPSGEQARLAAEAIEAAADLGGPEAAWGMIDTLSERRAAWADLPEEPLLDLLAEEADQLGLDADAFRTALEEGEYEVEIEAAITQAHETGVNEAPTIFVNDIQIYNPPASKKDIGSIALIRATEMQYAEKPPMVIDPERDYAAWIVTTRGTIALDLFADLAPETVNNFAYLACAGYYDGVPWHRVLPNFIAQAGDPSGTGLGGPGYTIPDEYERSALSFNQPGWISMARTTEADSASAQFFITMSPATHLDGEFTIFGEVVDGMDVVMNLNPRNPSQGEPEGEPDYVQTIMVREAPQD